MTTTPVTNLTSLFSSNTNINAVSNNDETKKSFTQVMGTVTGNSGKGNHQNNISQNTSDKRNPEIRTTVSKKNVRDMNQTDKKIKLSQTDEATVQDVQDKVNVLVQEVAEKLNVSENDVKEAMEALGVTELDLLNPDVLTDVVVAISGEDKLSLVMDETLYDTLNQFIDLSDEIKNDIVQEYDLTEESFPVFMENISEETKVNTDLGKTTELPQSMDTVEKTTNDMPLETMAADSQKITVTVEPDARKEVPAQVDTEQKSAAVQTENVYQTEETIEKPLVSNVNQNGTQEKNAEHGNQENGNSFLQSMTDAGVQFAENVNENVQSSSFQNALHTPDTESIMRQMMDYMRLHVGNNVSEMEIQLQPANLGTVNLQVASKNGVVTAQFTAQNETVKEALEAQIVQLRENFDERGIKVEAIEVTIASHEFERNLEQGEQEARDSERDEKVKKASRRRIMLNGNEEIIESSEDELDEAERIQIELMKQQGNRMNLMA